jgi:hypothetical protein
LAPAGASYFPLPFHLQQHQPPPPQVPPPMAASSYQQYQQQLHQAHQLFQRDAQTITPEALQSVKAALATSDVLDPVAAANARLSDPSTSKKPIPRRAAGQSWEDPTLTEWPESSSQHNLLIQFPLFYASPLFHFLVFQLLTICRRLPAVLWRSRQRS